MLKYLSEQCQNEELEDGTAEIANVNVQENIFRYSTQIKMNEATYKLYFVKSFI